MQKTYRVARGPLTINNIPPARNILDENGNVQHIPAGHAWFDHAGLYTTDNPDQQMWLEKHPEVKAVEVTK